MSSLGLVTDDLGLHQLQTSCITLVLDLDETLVHSTFERPSLYDFEFDFTVDSGTFHVYVQKRPGLDEFIDAIAPWFDVFILTASMSQYAVPLIATLIPDFPTSHILAREYCTFVNGLIIKDLTIFGRDLARMVLVDDCPVSFLHQPNNAIIVPRWVGGEDSALMGSVIPKLVACCNAPDVRAVLEVPKELLFAFAADTQCSA
jgi:RNA polymerase II subunit A small phosphatase-like protein